MVCECNVYPAQFIISLQFWSAGILKVIGDTAQTTSPLIVKAIIRFATESYTNHRTPNSTNRTPSVGTGIGLTFCLLALQMISSLCTNHFFYRSLGTGVLLHGGLITTICNRSLVLTSRARSTLTNGNWSITSQRTYPALISAVVSSTWSGQRLFR